MDFSFSFDVLVVNRELILKLIDFLNFQYFIKRLQNNANIPQGSHFSFTFLWFLITVLQINKMDRSIQDWFR